MTAEDSPLIFLTGATGFLGHFVLRDLLANGQRVVALVRSPIAETSVRLSKLLEQLDCDLSAHLASGQLRLVEGSMPEALPDPDWGATDAVLNCAASLQLFSNGNGDPFKTNVDGTQTLIDWCVRHGINRLHAVSTAYTCGWNRGDIHERFHHPCPEFQTDYERSKWTAEKVLEEWSQQSGRVLTIFRPSFLVGDSSTGYTTQFAGFYQLARLVSVLKEQYHDPNNGTRTYVPLRIPGRPNEPQNLVPVDFVSRMIANIVSQTRFHGRIYHLTNPQPPTNDTIKQACEEYFKIHGGYFTDPEDLGREQISPAESLIWDGYDLLTPRVTDTPHFDTTHTGEVMQAANITFPELNPQRITMLFDYAASQNWGKRTNGFHS